MGFIGVAQLPSLDIILDRAKHFLGEGKRVQIERRRFYGEKSIEHPYEYEYELYVDFEEDKT